MDFSSFEVWQTMGPIARVVVVLLAMMSMTSIAVAAERGIVLRRMRRDSLRFVAAWRPLLERGDSVAAARAAEKFPASPVARAVALATAALARAPHPASGIEASHHAVRRASLETASDAKRGLGLLATIGSTAPFVGLFGTVVGIVNAFQRMSATGHAGLASVSGGISEALVATALGIFVAIPAVWVFNALTHEIGSLLSMLEAAGAELAEVTLAPRQASLEPLEPPEKDRRDDAA
jgi:biopolymer transport protein ExbB/TolQ